MEVSRVRMFEWGTVLSKNPEKRKFLLEIFPDNPLYNIQVLSCTILKESPRHGETDLVAEVRVNACTTQSVYKFIEEFQDSSFANLNLLESGDRERNGQRTKVNISRKCHHNVDGRYLSQKRKEGVSERERVQGDDGKNTNCPSSYNFKLSACKEAAAGREGPFKTTNCKCLRFNVKQLHNHIVEGAESSKWHRVSKETRDLFEGYYEKKLSPPQAMIEHERIMIDKHGDKTWFSMSGDRSVCPEKKWVDNLWGRLRLINKGTLSGPDSYVRAVEWVKEYNSKHGDKFASVQQVKINERMEMFACVVDPKKRAFYTILAQILVIFGNQ